MSESERPLFSIGAVSRMLGCGPATIRTWEARYGLIVPARSPGGQRLFSADQVEQLRFVQEQLAAGVRPAEAHRLLRDRLSAAADGGERPGRLVLVESRAEAADVLRQLLASAGFEVVVADDPADAATRLGDAGLVVVDVAREDGRGAAFSRTAKRRGLPVIALGAEQDEAASRDAGADAFLPLPVDPGVLLQAARGLVRQPLQ